MYHGSNERRPGTGEMEQKIRLSEVTTIPDPGKTTLCYPVQHPFPRQAEAVAIGDNYYFGNAVGREATGTGELEIKTR